MHLNPLWKWEKQKAIQWIERKKKDFMKYNSVTDELPEDVDNDENIHIDNDENIHV